MSGANGPDWVPIATAVCAMLTCLIALANLVVNLLNRRSTHALQAQQQAASVNASRIASLNNNLMALEECVTRIESAYVSYESGPLSQEQRSVLTDIYNSVSMRIDKDNGNPFAEQLENTMNGYLLMMGARQGALPVTGSLPDLESLFERYRAAERDIIQGFAAGTR